MAMQTATAGTKRTRAELGYTPCERCGGYRYFTKQSAIFAGTTFRVNCQGCKGTGVAGVEVRRRAA